MNTGLNGFKNMTEEEKRKELKKIDAMFPSDYPGYNFKWEKTDKQNLYIGRIISILEELGEVNDWPKYMDYSVDKMADNYVKLLLRFIEKYKPELFSFYVEYHGLEELLSPSDPKNLSYRKNNPLFESNF